MKNKNINIVKNQEAHHQHLFHKSLLSKARVHLVLVFVVPPLARSRVRLFSPTFSVIFPLFSTPDTPQDAAFVINWPTEKKPATK